MLEKFLSEIEETFQISERGLVIAPDFCVPNFEKWQNFATHIEIKMSDGARKQTELVALSDQIEEADAQWLHYLLTLSQIRDMPVDELMDQLKLPRRIYA